VRQAIVGGDYAPLIRLSRRHPPASRAAPAGTTGCRPWLGGLPQASGVFMRERQHRSRSLLPALGVFAGGFAYALLPSGAFGPHDLAVRAAISGAVAGFAALL